jgi:hypothetical protein
VDPMMTVIRVPPLHCGPAAWPGSGLRVTGRPGSRPPAGPSRLRVGDSATQRTVTPGRVSRTVTRDPAGGPPAAVDLHWQVRLPPGR